MRAEHLEVLVEEPSMETFLGGLLPRILAGRATFTIHPHRGKTDLIAKIEGRLRGYRAWLPNNCRIAIVVDRDNDDCIDLKRQLEQAAESAGFPTRTRTADQAWQVVTRLAIEELEAWYFGSWLDVCAEYPKVPRNVVQKAAYRDPDSIAGGTWEALERIFRQAGYYSTGLPKVEVARRLGQRIDPVANSSDSFRAFCRAIQEAVA